MYRHHHRPHCGQHANQPIAQPVNQPIAQPGFQPIAQPGVQPIVCPPLCRYTDSYVRREVPYIQPLITCNRQHIVDVPKTYYREITQNVVVPPNRPPYGYGRR
jgi:hypothetical protein